MTSTIVVSGASGLLGRAVLRVLQASYSIVPLSYSRTKTGLVKCDLTNEQEVKELFSKWKPRVLVHCAAERRPDVVSKEINKAQSLNITATEYICRHAAANGCWVVYISTDYVFDGKAPPYAIDASPNPLNDYGKMKLEGEKILLKICPDGATLRIPILYGPIEYLSESAVTVIYESVRQTDKPCVHNHVQRRFPTHVDSVADVILQMVKAKVDQSKDVRGIYHFSESVMMTKYDMAVKMAQACNLSTGHIKADTSEPSPGSTPRPHDTQLDTTRLVQEGFTLPSISFGGVIKDILTSVSN